MAQNILFANGRPTPPITLGGDSVSVNILLEYLKNSGNKCFTFGVLNPDYSTNFGIHSTADILQKLDKLNIGYKFTRSLLDLSIQHNSKSSYLAIKRSISFDRPYYSKMVRSEFFVQELDKYVKQNKPEVIITQVEKVPEVIKVAKDNNIPIIIIIQDLELYNIKNIKLANNYSRSFVVFISSAVEKKFRVHCDTPCETWYHPLNIKPNPLMNTRQRYITMINPIFVKGGSTFKEIAQSLPEQSFLAVTNWYDSVKDNIDFSDTRNVTVIKRSDNMNQIYNKTKLLLIPSIWEEAFGRVAIEAATYGIPSIGSDSGGLKEAIGDGGVTIKRFTDVNEWINKIQHLLDKTNYKKYSRNAYKHSQYFDIKVQGPKFSKIIEHTIAR